MSKVCTHISDSVSARPTAFDARLAAYLPGLRAQAKHYCNQPTDVDDLVNDTVEHALKTWTDFRDGGAFWWWLKWRMRQVVAMRKKRAASARNKPCRVPAPTRTPATQEDAATISQVLSAMPERTRAIMLHKAMGEECPEVGARFGIGGERVRQIIRGARRELAAQVKI